MSVVALTAGGGGHTGYAIAIAQRLLGRAELIFVATDGDSWTERRASRLGRLFSVPRLRSPDDPRPLLLSAGAFARSLARSLRALPRDLGALISTGSNQAVAPALAARLRRAPVLNLECCDRIATTSAAARYLYRLGIASRTLLQWEEQLELYPRGEVVGPVYELPEREPFDGGYVLVTAGTYGYEELFDELLESGLESVVLQTGRVSPAKYARPGWVVFDFDPDFGRWLAGARVVVAHPGVTALNAALAYGKPVVVAHNPRWRLSVTREDARLLAEKLNGIFLEKVDARELRRAIEEAEGRRPPSYPEGAARAAEIALEEAARRGESR
ncbi:MAG: hypothetical protein QXU97_04235 [Fervidicoccaceae archaeon]